MILRVADLNIEVPEAGGLAPRCQAYLTGDRAAADIVIPESSYRLDTWEGISYENACYMESGYQFYARLLEHGGLMLHSSALSCGGKAYLFSGPSTVGKSTHTRMWQRLYSGVEILNDDKPALRCIDGVWYAYGTPWCGKDGINKNGKAPLAGICFLKQAQENRIRQLSVPEALASCLSQIQRFTRPENVEKQLLLLEKLVSTVPVWELENCPTEEAARLSHDTMVCGEAE